MNINIKKRIVTFKKPDRFYQWSEINYQQRTNRIDGGFLRASVSLDGFHASAYVLVQLPCSHDRWTPGTPREDFFSARSQV